MSSWKEDIRSVQVSQVHRELIAMQTMDDFLATLTPQRLREIILQAAERQPPGERAGVDVSSLIAQLVEGRDLGTGTERSQTHRKLVEAIRINVAQIEGMRYVKSSY